MVSFVWGPDERCLPPLNKYKKEGEGEWAISSDIREINAYIEALIQCCPLILIKDKKGGGEWAISRHTGVSTITKYTEAALCWLFLSILQHLLKKLFKFPIEWKKSKKLYPQLNSESTYHWTPMCPPPTLARQWSSAAPDLTCKARWIKEENHLESHARIEPWASDHWLQSRDSGALWLLVLCVGRGG